MNYQARLARLAARLDDVDAILITGMENIRYLSGFSGSSGAVVVGPENGWLITDFRYWEQAEREAPHLSLVRQRDPLWQSVAEHVLQLGIERVGFEADKLSVDHWQHLRGKTAQIAWQPKVGLVESLRMVKDPDELRLLNEAADIAAQALAATLARVKVGMEEWDVAVELESHMRQLGSDGPSFDTIAVAGPRASLPHGKPSRRRIEVGDLLTIDYGATTRGYHSDETVTVAMGMASTEARTVYEVVRSAQAAGLAQVRPGVAASTVDRAARAVIDDAGHGEFFGHSTGHGVGLEVHEAPWAGQKPATDWTLAEGMVLTVEPGIYLPGRLGVRLEDTVVVTSSGCQRVTKTDKAWREL